MYFLLKFWSAKVALHVTINVRELSLTIFFWAVERGRWQQIAPLCFVSQICIITTNEYPNVIQLSWPINQGGGGGPLPKSLALFLQLHFWSMKIVFRNHIVLFQVVVGAFLKSCIVVSALKCLLNQCFWCIKKWTNLLFP